MTQYERMVKGLIYDPADSEIMKKQSVFLDKLWEFNQLRPSDYEKKQKYMQEVFGSCGKNCYIELPLRANWGGHHLYMGSDVYVNYNLTIVDDGNIYIGDKVMIGPNVIIATANHPINPELRARGLQYNKDVHIGQNTWIGANTVIVPGIHIGKNTVIGAAAGFFLVCAAIITLHLLDDTIKSSDDLERYLGLNTLALIPRGKEEYDGRPEKKKWYQRFSKKGSR